MEQKMKKVGRLMNVYMGLTLSFFLSLTGNLSSGSFIPLLFLITFLVSACISLLIGWFVPMGRISRSITEKVKGIGGKLFDSFVSDLIYTPVITLAMIALVRKVVPVLVWRSAYSSALAEGAPEALAELAADAAEGAIGFPPFLIQFLSSLLICMVVGYLLILIFTPLYMKLSLKQCGIAGAPRKPQQP